MLAVRRVASLLVLCLVFSLGAAEQECAVNELGEQECAPVVEEESKVEDPKCPSREHIIACSGEYLDTNKNGLLERSELQGAIDALPWYARGIISILGSVDKMMDKCDVDGDGAISIEYDMHNNAETCLATCFKRRSYKGAFFPDCKL
jgi:hypothetical protein